MSGEDLARKTDELLREYLRDRNVLCPRCGYNLRNLTQPTCPECNEALVLRVGLQRVVVHWLLLTLAPSIFCALAMAAFLAISTMHGFPRRIPFEEMLTLGFLTFSGLAGLALAFASRWFMRQAEGLQILCTCSIWLIHVAAFVAFALII